MKKLLAVLFIVISACFVFVGCNSSSGQTPEGSTTPPTEQTPDEPSTPAEPEQPPSDEQPEQEEITEMYLTVNGNILEIALAENSSVDALVEILKEGDITFTADENGGFEMYGDIGRSLPTNNTQISAQAGDVLLYAGRYLCFFFGSNSYSYTNIGRINGYSASELRTLLGAAQGSVQVTISLG